MALPTGHDWLLKRIKALKYLINDQGMCFGILHMGMQAFFAGELDVFYKRLQMIKNISTDKFSNTIENFKNTAKNPALRAHLIEEEKRFIEIPAFFEGILLYQSPFRFPKLFATKPPIQNALFSHPLTLSKKLEQKKIVKGEKEIFSGIYDKTYLTLYFKSLQSSIEKLKPPLQSPLTLALSNCNHAIAICFDPARKNNKWLLIDANKLELINDWLSADEPKPQFESPEKLADQVIHSFKKGSSFKGITAFSTMIYSTSPHDSSFLNDLALEWKKTNDWQTIHPNIDKQKFSDTDRIYLSEWLYIAAKMGDVEKVKQLLKAGANPQFSTKNSTPLHIAAANGHQNVVEVLLKEEGMDPNLIDSGHTPLTVASLNGHTNIVQFLLNKGVSPNEKVDNVTPLHCAASNGHIDVVKLLLDKGADPNSAITIAAKNGHANVVKLLLDEGAYPNDALTLAASNGHAEVVKLLLDEGAKPDFLESNSNLSSLNLAVQQGHTDVAKLLLDHRANPNLASGAAGRAAIHFAIKNNDTDMLNLLLIYKPDINMAAKDGTTPLYLAVSQNNIVIVKKLLSAGCNPNKQVSGYTPLFTAVFNGNVDIVKLLLKHGADPNLGIQHPLLIAALTNKDEIVEILLRNKQINPQITCRVKTNELFQFAKKFHAEQTMSKFIENKFPNEKIIPISPVEIAEIMGNKKIANLFTQHANKQLQLNRMKNK